MFIGRKNELAKLNQLYEAGGFQFPVIYGRRRVGKTALINEFTKGKEVIFFTGIESNAGQNLENLSKSIFTYTSEINNYPVFSSFQDALEYVFKLAQKKQIILVMDEYPYVAKAYKALSSILQVLIDKNKNESGLFLILCGSSMSFMEEQVLGYNSPLYGRRTAQMKIQAFDFAESCQYFNGFTAQSLAQVYGIVGGTPQYLLQMNDKLSVEENIKANLLDTNSYLFEEPSNLLKQEVREAALYNAIISAVAGGSTKLSEIAGKVGAETSACSICIKKLISLGILDKESPFGETSTKKTIYTIKDNLFRFWYRFIPTNLSMLQNNMVDLAYNNIAEHLNAYMGAVFEDICKQYLWHLNAQGKAAFAFTDLGRWWGNDPRSRSEIEVDIMGTDGKKSAFLGECKWTNEKVGIGVLKLLEERSKLFKYDNIHLYLFSRSGFTEGCVTASREMGTVTLISFDEIMENFRKN